MPATMDVCFELFIYFFFEFGLSLLSEFLAELSTGTVGSRTPTNFNPFLKAIGFAVLGILFGALTLWPFPKLFIQNPTLRIINLIVTPLLVGAARLGIMHLERKKPYVFTAAPFVNAAIFAL